ncbi:MAG: cytochrome c [Rhizobiaceae bacterium]|nr:cytochrome c [Rhizobiaceae bacterium]
MKKFLLLLGFLSAFPVSAEAQSQSEISAIVHGEGLAKLNCSTCHSIGLSGESPNKDAPAFRTFSSYRSITLIGWELMNKDWGEHRKMPQFQITADQVRDILEWIRWVQPVPHGRRLVQKNCSQCHAIDMNDDSAHPAAIPFRNISVFYPVEALEEAFAEGIMTGHPDMPEYEASPDQITAIIAYLNSIQENVRQ